MIKSLVFIFIVMLSACASFDKTNIQPGHRVIGLGFSFTVPTEKSWFAVEYGTSHRIKLSQLNNKDSYSILVSLNRGPYNEMYQSAEAHLKAIKQYKNLQRTTPGLIQHSHQEWIEAHYNQQCVRYSSLSEDARGRNNLGPATVNLIGLSCQHPSLKNVLITTSFTRRSDEDASKVDITTFADQLFSSFEFTGVE